MGILSKIKIGRKSDRNFFDFSHDVNTTSDFGFCQPTLLQNIVADSKLTLNTKSFVRLAPLPVPTFGRINVKQHTAFVPYRDIFLGYDNFVAGKSIASGVRTYIPTQANTITNSRLFNFIANCSYIASRSRLPETLLNNLFFKVGVFFNENVLVGDEDEYVDLFNPYDLIDDNFDARIIANRLIIARYLFEDDNSPFNRLMRDTFGHTLNYMDTAFRTSNVGNPYYPLFADLQLHKDHREQFLNIPTTETDYWGTIESEFLYNVSDYDIPFFSERITMDNADFIFSYINDNDFTVSVYQPDLTEKRNRTFKNNFIFCIKLTRLGRRLFKILNADRINFGYKDVPVDFLSLLSYYKVWFEQYNPGRNLVWEETNAYKLIHSFYDFGKDLNDCYDYDSISVDNFTFVTSGVRRNLAGFLSDMANCTYTLPVDNITVATEDLLTNVDDTKATDVSVVDSYDDGIGRSDVGFSSNEAPYGGLSRVDAAGGLGIKLLERIYHLVNKNSVLGSRIDEYLKAHNLGSPLPESLILNDNDYSITVDEQMSTAETAEGYLGEYAGKAKAFNNGDFMKFETPNSGVLVQYLTIVPYGGYVQAGRIGMVNRYDFYNAFYDSLGREPLTQYEVSSRFYHLNDVVENSVFGFVPQYFSKKVVNNLANGGFAFRSQNGQFLPYSLDRLFSVPDLHLRRTIRQRGTGEVVTYIPEFTAKIDLIADEYLRFIGRNEGFGNYNRIFYDTTGLTDNFIVQMIHELHVYSPMKPVSESFDTYDKDVDNGYVEVKHS